MFAREQPISDVMGAGNHSGLYSELETLVEIHRRLNLHNSNSHSTLKLLLELERAYLSVAPISQPPSFSGNGCWQLSTFLNTSQVGFCL